MVRHGLSNYNPKELNWTRTTSLMAEIAYIIGTLLYIGPTGPPTQANFTRFRTITRALPRRVDDADVQAVIADPAVYGDMPTDKLEDLPLAFVAVTVRGSNLQHALGDARHDDRIRTRAVGKDQTALTYIPEAEQARYAGLPHCGCTLHGATTYAAAAVELENAAAAPRRLKHVIAGMDLGPRRPPAIPSRAMLPASTQPGSYGLK